MLVTAAHCMISKSLLCFIVYMFGEYSTEDDVQMAYETRYGPCILHPIVPGVTRCILRWLIFPSLVLHILFQLQFGSSHQYEIYHRHKTKLHRIIASYFFQKTCYHGNDITHSVAPPESKAIVLLRERVGEIFSNSHITCY